MENNTNSQYNFDSIYESVSEGTCGHIQSESNYEKDVDISPPLSGNTGDILTTGALIMPDLTIIETPLSVQDILLNDSRITPTGNGNSASKPYCTQPTSGHKWWAAVLLGFIFALVSSPAAYYVSSKVTTSLGGISTMEGPGPNFVGLLIHTLVFIIIVRIILW